MHSHSVTSALTLYRSGTLTLTQAAAHAGRTEAEFRAMAAAHGADTREGTVPGDDPFAPVRAD